MERIQIAVSLHIVSFVAFRILPSADAGQPLERLITDHPEHPEHGDTAPPRVPRDVSARRHGVDVRRRPLSARDDRFREFTKHGWSRGARVSEPYPDRVCVVTFGSLQLLLLFTHTTIGWTCRTSSVSTAPLTTTMTIDRKPFRGSFSFASVGNDEHSLTALLRLARLARFDDSSCTIQASNEPKPPPRLRVSPRRT